jgi:hypothetical protein
MKTTGPPWGSILTVHTGLRAAGGPKPDGVSPTYVGATQSKTYESGLYQYYSRIFV